MINKDRENFQYRGGDLVYIISQLTSQLRTNSRKIAVKYVGPVVVYKIIDPHNIFLYLYLYFIFIFYKRQRIFPLSPVLGHPTR